MGERRKEVFSSFHDSSFIVMTEPWSNLIVACKAQPSVQQNIRISWSISYDDRKMFLPFKLYSFLNSYIKLTDKNYEVFDEKNVKWHLQGKERRMKEVGIKKILIWKCWLKKEKEEDASYFCLENSFHWKTLVQFDKLHENNFIGFYWIIILFSFVYYECLFFQNKVNEKHNS